MADGSTSDDRSSIVAYIEAKANAFDARRADPKWGSEYAGDAVILRALAGDIRARLDLDDAPCPDAPPA